MEHQAAIEAAVKTILGRREDVRRYQDAAAGRYEISVGSDRFRRYMSRTYSRIADNLAPRVLAAVNDRLQVLGIDPYAPHEALEKLIGQTSRQMRFDALQKRVHWASIRDGSAYLVVTRDPIRGIKMHVNTADICEVARDPECPEDVVAAVKLWQDDQNKSVRMTVYYPDRIERWISQNSDNLGWWDSVSTGKPLDFSTFEAYTADGESVVPHDFGIVPVFAYLNQPDHRFRGVSELASVLPIQEALNAAFVNLLSASEAYSLPTRYILGLATDYDENGNIRVPKPENGSTWVFGAPDLKIGQLAAADLRMMIESINDLRHEIARVSGVPIHLLQLTTSYPSGEALKVAEAALIGKITDRQVTFGNSWEDLFTVLTNPGENYLRTRWLAAEQVDLMAQWQSATLQHNVGISLKQILKERGYTLLRLKKFLPTEPRKTSRNRKLLPNFFNAGSVGRAYKQNFTGNTKAAEAQMDQGAK